MAIPTRWHSLWLCIRPEMSWRATARLALVEHLEGLGLSVVATDDAIYVLGGIGEIVESKNARLPVGSWVGGMTGPSKSSTP